MRSYNVEDYDVLLRPWRRMLTWLVACRIDIVAVAACAVAKRFHVSILCIYHNINKGYYPGFGMTAFGCVGTGPTSSYVGAGQILCKRWG